MPDGPPALLLPPAIIISSSDCQGWSHSHGETQSGNLGDTTAMDALAALRMPDPRSLFWIVGGAMAPEDAAAYQQRVMAQFDVPASVPETVTKSFDRLRTIYQQALLCYDLYTVAGDQARLVAELALRERFVEFYGGTVLFTDGQGKSQTVRPPRSTRCTTGSAGPTAAEALENPAAQRAPRVRVHRGHGQPP